MIVQLCYDGMRSDMYFRRAVGPVVLGDLLQNSGEINYLIKEELRKIENFVLLLYVMFLPRKNVSGLYQISRARKQCHRCVEIVGEKNPLD